MSMHQVADALAAPLFRWRRALLALFVFVSLLLGWSASQLRVDAGFEKMIPLEHEYMQTFTAYRSTFGGANRVLVALRLAQGDIYQAEFLDILRAVTDEVFFIPGVDRATVTSLFTPNVRFIEVVEAGFAGGNLIPADYDGSEADLEQIRNNVLKSDYVGRLVANDHGGALVSAELLEIDPVSGERLDYTEVAERLEEIRARHAGDGLDVHIIGFAKAVGDITDGAEGVLIFFL
ncbi:MAG: RND family transporter, partial [Gammaproteobacteria bacterium]|nr:RND family transporter [Gammaproteobacteria bacterium]